jgi:uncharacterized repeat protein (TIGR01451 family)
MKKIYYYIVLLFASFTHAQTIIEDFENGIPPTWAVFESGTGITNNWTATSSPTLVCQGNSSAYMLRENVASGMAIDWLVSPLISVPANGDLSFVTKTLQTGVQGTNFSVKVSTTSQTDPNSFTSVATWDEASLTTMANNCQEKVVNLNAFAGQNVYIAFVMENDNGDRWIVDNIRMHQNLFRVVAFLDLNNNGIKEITENYFNIGNYEVSINNGAITNYNTNSEALYIHPVNGTDLYDISFAIQPEYAGYYSSSTNYNDVNPALLGLNTTLYLPITQTNLISDVATYVCSLTTPRPGFNYYNQIYYYNNGEFVENGTIEFTKPANFTITNISDVNAVQNATGFTLNYTNLQPSEWRSVLITMTVPPFPTVQIGQIVTSSVTINCNNTEIFSNNNSGYSTDCISSSYDPNDINENHGPNIVKDNFTNEDYLVYTIRFQNTGNASTAIVRVEDFLDTKLNPATVRMIGASHEYILSMQNNHLVWKFDPIYLSPMSVNEANSNGHITFKVKPFPGYEVGDIIPNTASIYFDTNPAIVTNTFQTEFIAVLANDSFNLDIIDIYPNPSNDYINIQVGENENRIQSIEITDLLGKKVYQSKFENRINISNLNQGVYFITLISNENEKFTKKIIKE